jgi:hypothetical protein
MDVIKMQIEGAFEISETIQRYTVSQNSFFMSDIVICPKVCSLYKMFRELGVLVAFLSNSTQVLRLLRN